MSRGGEALLERAEQLAALQSCWSAVRAEGRGVVVCVAGEAGVGKTALVRSFTASLPATARVLVGSGDALHTARPLGPFLDLAAPDGPLHRAIDGAARPFEVTSALLEELGDAPDVVVVLEDLHWADEASLDVLRLLARRLEKRPALVVLTYRDDELGATHPLRILLGEISTGLTRIRVPALSAEGVARLARPYGVDGEQLYAKTAGNAFFVTEVLAAPEGSIPDSVRDAVLARAARLDPAARSLLETVALVPQQVELWVLDEVAPGGGDALDACIESGILHHSEAGVGFRHELARLAVEQSVAPGRRRTLHRRLVEALAAPPDNLPDVTRLAHHAVAAADGAAVVRYAREAATQAAAVGAHREAAAHYAAVLRYAAHLEAGALPAVHAAHSQECYLADDGAQAIASAVAAAEGLAGLGDRLGHAEAMLWLATVQRMNGRPAESAASLAQALRILDGASSGKELGRAYAGVALAAMSSADTPGAVTAVERAVRIADEHGDVETRIHALITLATVHMESPETYAAGEAAMREQIAAAAAAGRHELVGRAYNNLAYEAFAHHDLDLAEATVHAAVAYASEHGVDLWLRIALGSQAEVELARGQWDAAADTALQVLSRPGAAIPRMGPLTTLGVIRARRGDPDPWGPLDEALDIAQGSGELQMMVPVAAARAEAAWLEGRPEAVIAESEAVVRRAISAGDAWALADVACWRMLVGKHDELPDLADSPRTLELAGQPAQAAQRWSTLGYPYEAALALVQTDEEPALREALTQLQRLGANATAAIVARRLRERGARGIPRGPRPSTATNAAQLTRREVEVVGLIVSGLGNAQIAQRLHLSEKTVGHHVSAVFRKLGVTSRAHAASEAERRGLVTAPPT